MKWKRNALIAALVIALMLLTLIMGCIHRVPSGIPTSTMMPRGAAGTSTPSLPPPIATVLTVTATALPPSLPTPPPQPTSTFAAAVIPATATATALPSTVPATPEPTVVIVALPQTGQPRGGRP